MKAKFNNKTNILSFGKYGKLKMQKGSTVNHKVNGLIDTDILAGLMAYIGEMNQQKKSDYNILGLNNLNSAYAFLRLRRLVNHAKAVKDKKDHK